MTEVGPHQETDRRLGKGVLKRCLSVPVTHERFSSLLLYDDPRPSPFRRTSFILDSRTFLDLSPLLSLPVTSVPSLYLFDYLVSPIVDGTRPTTKGTTTSSVAQSFLVFHRHTSPSSFSSLTTPVPVLESRPLLPGR